MLAEMEYCLSAARSAIAKASNDLEELDKQEKAKTTHLSELKEQNASTLKLRELIFLP
jgi:hypothetical protein